MGLGHSDPCDVLLCVLVAPEFRGLRALALKERVTSIPVPPRWVHNLQIAELILHTEVFFSHGPYTTIDHPTSCTIIKIDWILR